MRTKVRIRHDNKHIKIFSNKSQFPSLNRNLPVFELRIKTFKTKKLKNETHSLKIRIFNQDPRLKSLLQILITSLIHSKLRLPVIKVVIQITYGQTVLYENNPSRRGVRNPSIKITTDNYAAQGSKAQICKESPAAKTRHM